MYFVYEKIDLHFSRENQITFQTTQYVSTIAIVHIHIYEIQQCEHIKQSFLIMIFSIGILGI